MGAAPQLSPLEQLTAGQPGQGPPAGSDLSPLEQLVNMQSQTSHANLGAPIQPVTNATNPKLNIAASGENMPEYVGATGAAGAALMAGAPVGDEVISAAPKIAQIIQATAKTHPIIAKLLMRALEGSALAEGVKWSHLLHSDSK